MPETEQRLHPRAEYFLIKSEGQVVPVYAFRDAADTAAIPALVVDLSTGGLQILTTHSTGLVQDTYSLEMVLDEVLSPPLERAPVVKIWERRDGLNFRSGFAFHGSSEMPARIAALLEHAPHHVLRCVLHPNA